jgi:hypothetical protein
MFEYEIITLAYDQLIETSMLDSMGRNGYALLAISDAEKPDEIHGCNVGPHRVKQLIFMRQIPWDDRR